MAEAACSFSQWAAVQAALEVHFKCLLEEAL
jgi:hypothetical protein